VCAASSCPGGSAFVFGPLNGCFSRTDQHNIKERSPAATDLRPGKRKALLLASVFPHHLMLRQAALSLMR
jgi:hypothetical protein